MKVIPATRRISTGTTTASPASSKQIRRSRMNRLAGIVAGTALAGGEDKWYQDSARLLSYNVLKSGATGQREQTTHR